MEINTVLTWLASAGGAIAAFSWIAEQIPAWHEVKDTKKKLVSFLGSAVTALAAWGVLTYASPEFLAAIQEPFALIAGVFASVFLGEVFHKVTKK